MTRQLPWALKPSNKTTAERSRATASPVSVTSRTTGDVDRAKTPRDSSPRVYQSPLSVDAPSRRSLGTKLNRWPSTSPPPQAPEEKFMLDGIENDDGYRMVEDEFLSVAGEFTRHLHAAEYQRLKQLAKAQNAETIRNISRPITGAMSDLVKRRQTALSTAASQRQGLRKVLASRGASAASLSGDEESPWVGTSLQGLMGSPQKRPAPLSAIASVHATTRARAGYRAGSRVSEGTSDKPGMHARSSTSSSARLTGSHAATARSELAGDSEEETEDEDLDAPAVSMASYRGRSAMSAPRDAHSVSRPVSLLPTSYTSSTPRTGRLTSHQTSSEPPKLETYQRAKPVSTSSSAHPMSIDLDDEDDEDDDIFARIRQRQNEKRKQQ